MSHISLLNASCNITKPERRHPSGVYKVEYHTILVILAICILVHNSIVLYLYRNRRSLRTSTNLLLASTACADLLTGLLLIPFVTSSAVMGGRSPDLSPLYFTSNVISDFLTIVIVLNISLVTIERYTALCHPYFYQNFVSKSFIWKVIAAIWTVSALVAVIQITWSYPVLAGKSSDLSGIYQIYSIATIITVFLFPTAVIIFCQVRMFLVVKRFANVDSMRGLSTGVLHRPQLKALFVFLAMFVNVFLCWSPLMTVRMMMDISPRFMPGSELLEIFLFLRCLSSLLDPAICVWCKKDFKQAFSKVFCSAIKRHQDSRNVQRSYDNENNLRECAF